MAVEISPSKNFYLPALDGLRALAFLLVFIHHSPPLNESANAFSKIYTCISAWGWCGVDLFFVLSAFLITTILFKERALNGQISLKKFLYRRALRIWPLFYAFLTVGALIARPLNLLPQHDGFEVLATNLAFLGMFVGNFSMMCLKASATIVIFQPLWSLCIEEQFYLIWGTVNSKVRSTRVYFNNNRHGTGDLCFSEMVSAAHYARLSFQLSQYFLASGSHSFRRACCDSMDKSQRRSGEIESLFPGCGRGANFCYLGLLPANQQQ